MCQPLRYANALIVEAGYLGGKALTPVPPSHPVLLLRLALAAEKYQLAEVVPAAPVCAYHAFLLVVKVIANQVCYLVAAHDQPLSRHI